MWLFIVSLQIRLASTHDSDDEPDQMQRLKTPSHDSIRRKMSQDFYSASDSDGESMGTSSRRSSTGHAQPTRLRKKLTLSSSTQGSDDEPADPNDFTRGSIPTVPESDDSDGGAPMMLRDEGEYSNVKQGAQLYKAGKIAVGNPEQVTEPSATFPIIMRRFLIQIA